MLVCAVAGVFDAVPQAPEDPILGVTLAYNADQAATKLNLGVGAYRTEEGKPWVLPVVKKVRQWMGLGCGFVGRLEWWRRQAN